MTAVPEPTPTSATTTGLQVDLRQVIDYSLPLSSTGALQTTSTVVRQVMVLGDPATAANVAEIIGGGQTPTEDTMGLSVHMIPGQRDLMDIKELLFQILQQLIRNGNALGAAPITQPVETGN